MKMQRRFVILRIHGRVGLLSNSVSCGVQANLLSRTIGRDRDVRSEADAVRDSAWGEDGVSGDGDFDRRLGGKRARLFALTLRGCLLYVLGSSFGVWLERLA